MRRLVLTQSLKVQKVYVRVLGRGLRNRKLSAPSWSLDGIFRNQGSNETMPKPTPSAIVLHAVRLPLSAGTGLSHDLSLNRSRTVKW
jgi:hypothetical protein